MAFCLGCNDAANQQQTNKARQSTVAGELEKQGEAMHNAQTNDLGTANTQDAEP
jgi:hypothetical protein